MLRRLRLQLVRGGDVGDEGQVDVDRVAAPDVLPELPDRLEERERLDVAHRAADLDEDDVVVAGHAADAVLDLVRDVRDDLHGLPEVVAAPLLLDDGLVDLPGRDAVRLSRDGGGEALVVPEVEVGLGAVVGHVDLAVLERGHRAGIDVDVRVELLEGDLEAPGLEERAHRGRRDPLAEARDHAAGDEDVLRPHRSPPRRPSQTSSEIRLAFSRISSTLRGILDRVDPDRVARGIEHGHRHPGRERAELLEALGPLERVRRQGGPARRAPPSGSRRARGASSVRSPGSGRRRIRDRRRARSRGPGRRRRGRP